MNNDVSIKEIRDTLGSYQIPKNQIEKKGGFDYLKWSYALGVFLQHYPDARWEFTQWEQADGTMVDVQYYKDGSCSVECRVFVGNVSQYMWLPVTDFKNKPVTNCQDINTAKMRCLTKCIAVCFGLGSDIYGMDMLQEIEGGSEVPTNESPIPKSTSVATPPSSFIEEPDAPENNYIKGNATPRLKGDDPIPVGYNKGETYNQSYNNCSDLNKVRKDLKYWKPKTDLNEDQQLHLNTLIALEQHIIKTQERALLK